MIFFGDRNLLARMVDDLGQSIGNVGTNICRHSSIENIVEANECDKIFALGGVHVLNAYLFWKV